MLKHPHIFDRALVLWWESRPLIGLSEAPRDFVAPRLSSELSQELLAADSYN